MRVVDAPGALEIDRADRVVRRYLAPTPVVASPSLGPNVLLKLETLQPTGSFKVRGGLAAVAAAQADAPGTPLVAASAGNHGLGVAYAADRLGADATVVVPETASPAKVHALECFGVTLVRHGAGYEDAERKALELAAAKGGRFVSPYNDPDVIAGQGSTGRELLGQVPGVGTVVIPVGGGGLLAGVGLATEGAGVHIVGVEPELSTAVRAAMRAGSVVEVEVGPTIADGLAGNIEPGSVTVDLARRLSTAMLTVSEDEIKAAIRYLAFEHGIVAEGAGAVATAALLAGRLDANQLSSDGAGGKDRPTVVLVTGRNITPSLLAEILTGDNGEGGGTNA
jgi:threonine dehydratase